MVEYRILEAGYFYADGGAMFGAIPKRAWQRKCHALEDNTCLMSMSCVLLWGEGRVVVLDTGVGTRGLESLSYYRFFNLQSISEMLRPFGFEPADVTDVVLSHLHFDHCGGCTYLDAANDLQISFPNAQHWVSERQWASYCAPNRLEKDAFRPDDMMPIYNKGLLRLIEGDCSLFEGLDLQLYDGHSLGQIVSFFNTKEGMYVYPSDVIPTKAHLSVDWISAYDIEPLASVEAKIKLLQEITDRAAKCIFYH